MSANIKFAIHALAFFILVYTSPDLIVRAINIPDLGINVKLSEYSILFTILCFLLFSNAFNMFDGINLQASSYGIFIFLFFIYKGFFPFFFIVLIVSLATFWYLNFKNKCFLGNSGNILLSFVISYFFIKISITDTSVGQDQIFLLMCIPGFDMLRLFIHRIIKKKNPFSSDRNHIHHLLLNKYGFHKAILFLLSLIIIPNFLSALYQNAIYYVILSLIIYVFLFLKLKE